MSTTTVTAANGITFTVRLVREGERYGLNLCLTHDKPEPLVEFYDTRYQHTPLGQFVSRYYADTLLNHPTQWGLDLDSGVPSWTIDGPSYDTIHAWLKEQVA